MAECAGLGLEQRVDRKLGAVVGFELGRDRFGVFPLRGKLLNVRDVGVKAALGNAEVAALVAILGLAFITFGTNFFFPFLPAQESPPPGSPPALFMGALYPTGYLGFVKALEILGGLLTAIPRTRSLKITKIGNSAGIILSKEL